MTKVKKTPKPRISDNPLSKRTITKRSANSESASARALPRGMARHILKVQPATGFEYRYESPRGNVRVFHLERGALERGTGTPAEVNAFRAGATPGESPTRGGFYTSPDSLSLAAMATILIEGGASGDFIICRSFGSWDGLKVTLEIFRQETDGSVGRILREELQDANEHKFSIP